eukprot:PhF_6_TR440/c0_g1_i1/m.164/K10849/ERCC1; DNA excision repair protein ERCC-1
MTTPNVPQLIVNTAQRGNAVLHHLKDIPWSYGSTLGDYQYDSFMVMLYIQLRYLLCHETYLLGRMKPFLNSAHRVKVCLCYCDVTDCAESLMTHLNVLCITYGFTLMCFESITDAAFFIKQLGECQKLTNDALKGPDEPNAVSVNPLPRLRGVLSAKEGQKLAQSLGSLADVFTASVEELSLVPGIGEVKSSKLHTIFHTSMRTNVLRKRVRPPMAQQPPQPQVVVKPPASDFVQAFAPSMEDHMSEFTHTGFTPCLTNPAFLEKRQVMMQALQKQHDSFC